uniref:Mediator of RNA polymerase II transcription subunit 20 n=1 Tax=Oncorhynchus mykiss TaxID=8022 RepID=A0A8C7U221_ONCMY
MGVTCVCQVPLSEGKSVQQTISILHKKLEQLGAVKQEDLLWTVRLTMPQEMPGVTKVALGSLPDMLMAKLKSHFQNAKRHKVESRGSHHRYYDFLIKVGAVSDLYIPRDMYCNCMVPGDCWNLMKELMQSFLGPSIVELPSVFATMLEGLYAPAYCVNTMTQYLKMFSKVCKQQVLPGTTLCHMLHRHQV